MDTSIYIHIPFCRHRCAYCDFNTYAGQEDSIPAYVDALRREIEYVGEAAPQRLPVHTVFFGGGTPSLLSPDQFRIVLQALGRSFDVRDEAEITMEANPGTVTPHALKELRQLGINRISFGAQSANGEELRMLERAHSFLDVIEAVTRARRAGFDNLNLDLIYGLPEQAVGTWQTTVRRVLELRPEHISAYALTLEHGTPFGRWSSRGLLATPDPDAAAEMYEWAGEALEEAGYQQYEISNWALKHPAASAARADDGGDARGPPTLVRRGWPIPALTSRDLVVAGRSLGQRLARSISSRLSVDHPAQADSLQPAVACRHNLQYWRGLPYLGLGAGAHGYASGHRYSNVLRIKTYIDRMQGTNQTGEAPATFPMSPAAVNQHKQTVQEDMSEFMITGLRLTREGIEPGEFERRFGRTLEEIYGREIEELRVNGLLERIETRAPDEESREVIRLTKRGRLLGNQVFVRFV